MRTSLTCLLGCGVLLFSAGCLTADGSSAFLTVTDVFGESSFGDGADGGGSGGSVDAPFRLEGTLTLVNNSDQFDLETSFIAWVNVSSIRSADDQDTLLAAGYRQLTSQLDIGTIYTLPPGTFVLNGPGFAGATPVVVGPSESESFELIAPDVLLVYQAPPTSCDSIAFTYTQQGFPITTDSGGDDFGGRFGGATSDGPLKTLAQIDAYECSPLQPGIFLKTGGGARQANEFFEGQAIQFDFFQIADATGLSAIVSVQ